MTAPNRPEHADKIETIPGASPRLRVKRVLTGYAYAANGNTTNPTPRYLWLLLADGEVVDQAHKRGVLIDAARANGPAYLKEVDES